MTRSWAHTVRGLWASSHPGPTVVVTVLAAALSISAGLEAWRMTLLTAAVLAGQLSVGISNDALDAGRDRAVGRVDKPIAQGEVSIRAAWISAVGSLVLALVLSAPLGVGLFGAHAVFLASAWSYNAGLKATALSLAPFILSFGLFPSFATLAAPQGHFAPYWAWIAGAALGAAVHLTNVLPDLDDDARTGIHGLPHRLGLRLSAVLAVSTVLIGALAVTLGPVGARLSEAPMISWVFFGLILVVVLAVLVLVSAGRSGRILFRLVMLASLVLAIQLIATGGALMA